MSGPILSFTNNRLVKNKHLLLLMRGYFLYNLEIYVKIEVSYT